MRDEPVTLLIPATFAHLGQPRWGDINTHDAVFEVLEKLERLSGRRVLILVGSGLDSLSYRTLGDVQDKLERVNAVVYSVGAGSQRRGSYEPYLSTMSRMKLLQAEAFLRMLADKAGGEAWFPRSSRVSRA